MKTEFFQFQRFFLLLKRQSVLNYKTWFTALISVGGAIIFFATLSLVANQDDGWLSVFQSLGTLAFFVTGLVFASLAFNEMGTHVKSLQYITLPATLFEKFFAMWLLTSVAYFVLATFTLVISSAFVGMLSVLIFKGNFLIFNPFTSEYGETAIAYFMLHSAFFLGAVWFKKAAFFKTLLTMFVLNIITNAWLFVWVMILINPFKMLTQYNNVYFPVEMFAGMEKILVFWVKIFVVLLSLIFLITAWFRFKEREV